MNILTMGTCRVGTWDSSLFSKVQVDNHTEKGARPFTTHMSNSKDLQMYVNPTGYCTSPPEFVDLLRVLQGHLPYVDKKESSMHKEIHKYLDSDILTHVDYNKVLLEVCSRRFLKAPQQLKTKYNWGGQTIPYKVMYESTQKEFSFENVNAQFKSNLLLTDLEIENYLSIFVSEAQVLPNHVYVLGNYILPPLGTSDCLTLPLSVIHHRIKLNDLLHSLSKKIGFQYLDFTKILELDKDTSSLSDVFHLSNLGVQRLSHYIHDLIDP